MQLARGIVEMLEDKKGENILLMDIKDISTFTDYFVICSGTSDRMLNSLADAVCDGVKKDFGLNSKIEGQAVSGWLVVDLGDVTVHLFAPEQRSFYNLEQLWERGKVLVRVQ